MTISSPTLTSDQLRQRAESARNLLRSCRLCPRECKVDRISGETGFCGLTAAARCVRDVVYYHEEPQISPAHSLFFTGCNLRCDFCAVAEWNESPCDAPELDCDDMRQRILARRKEGAETLNFLGGEPSVNLHAILELLAPIRNKLRVVWNSNMYFSDDAACLLDDVVDIYLADFKCGSSECAKRLLGAGDYIEVVKKNLLLAQQSADLIVRHVILPGHSDCCLRPVLSWIKENLPAAKVNLMQQYLPPVAPKTAPKDFLSDDEFRAAIAFAESLNLDLIR